jgi:hypothetical protein
MTIYGKIYKLLSNISEELDHLDYLSMETRIAFVGFEENTVGIFIEEIKEYHDYNYRSLMLEIDKDRILIYNNYQDKQVVLDNFDVAMESIVLSIVDKARAYFNKRIKFDNKKLIEEILEETRGSDNEM